MGRTSKAIEMLILLKTRNRLRKSELAELLKVKPRYVLELKQELIDAGYAITAYNGKNGGYELNYDNTLPMLVFSNDEQETLKMFQSYLVKNNALLHAQNCALIIDKVLASSHNVSEDFYLVYNSVQLLCPKETLEKYYRIISHAINKKFLIEFTYEKTDGSLSEVSLAPHYLSSYRNGWYVIGITCLEKRTYKLNRIKEIKVTNIPFISDKKVYIDSNNNFDLELLPIELIIRHRNDIAEYKYSENQCIKRINKDSFYFSADMHEFAAWSLIKNLGSDCTVIKPASLKKKQINDAKIIIQNYKT